MYVYIKYDKNPLKLSIKIKLSCCKLINLLNIIEIMTLSTFLEVPVTLFGSL